MAPKPTTTACFINPSYQSVCLYVLLSKGLVNTFHRQPIHETTEHLLDASFSVQSVSYQRRDCGFVLVSPILVDVPQKRFEGPQNRQTVWNPKPRISVLERTSSSFLESTVYTISLLGNGSINTFPRRRIVGGVVFYAVLAVLRESR
jgi:hypothetical protein